ncbi:MAG: hypothetical protein NHB15_16905 [Methanosarcina barkeri]|nr:hypothetical protein [Methanosarcina sp. ERenArc_MAG2]
MAAPSTQAEGKRGTAKGPQDTDLSKMPSYMTIKQILTAGNLSEDQSCLMEMFLEAECYEEQPDEKLLDSMFMQFPSLNPLQYRDDIIWEDT